MDTSITDNQDTQDNGKPLAGGGKKKKKKN